MTTPNASISVNRRGLGVATSSGGDILAVLGPATSGDYDKAFSLGSSSNIRSKFARGPMVQLACFVREAIVKSQPLGRPIVCVRCKTSTPGAMADLDVSKFTGTAEPAKGTTTADDDYQLRIKWIKGTAAIGTAGATYQVSKDDGRSYGVTTALGAGSTVEIPDSGGLTLSLDPPETEFVNFVANLRTKALAHFIFIAGGVHLAADTSSDDGIGAAPTDWPTGIARLNEIRTGCIAHATNNTAHTADDGTSFASLPAAAVTKHEAVALAATLDSAFATHLATEGSVHGAADATNVLTVDPPTHGSIVAGDEIAADTTAPAPSDSDLDDALQALQTTKLRWDLVALTPPVASAGTVGVITDRVSQWEAAKKYRPVLCNFRLPNAGEDAADYRVAWKARFDAINCDAMNVGYDGCIARCRIDKLARYRRPAIWGYAALAIAAPPGEDLAWVDNGLGAIPDVTILDDDGNPLFHDEDSDPGPDDDRAVTLRTVPGYSGTFVNNPRTLAQPGTDLWLLQYYRAVAKSVACAHLTFTGQLSMKLEPDTQTGLLAKHEVEKLQGVSDQDQLRDVITPGWAVESKAALDNTVNLFQTPVIPIEISIVPYLYAKGFSITIGLKNPFAKTAGA